MKSHDLLRFMGFLFLAAIDLNDASLIGAGRAARVKKNSERETTEEPYICLKDTNDLPSCNFSGIGDEEIDEILTRGKTSLGHIDRRDFVEDETSLKENPGREYTPGVTIVFEIQDCMPDSFRFTWNICKTNDLVGRIVQTQKIVPFTVVGKSITDGEAPLVFPDINADNVHRFTKGSQIRQSKKEDDEKNSEPEVPEEPESRSSTRQLPKREDFGYENVKDENTIPEKIVLLPVTKRIGKDNLEEKFHSFKDGGVEKNIYRIENEKSDYLTEKNDKNNNKEEKNDNGGKKKLYDGRDEFPYEKAIPYDPEKLFGAKIGSEFLYERAIPFDPKKLEAAKRGSEFPYSRAMPYDAKKLKERKNESMEKSLRFYKKSLKVVTRNERFQVVPFDTKMLEAAEVGSIFPYGKETPEVMSKILQYGGSAISEVTETEELPVRDVVTYTINDHRVPKLTRKLTLTKEEETTVNKMADFDKEDNSRKTYTQADFSSPNSRIVRGVSEESVDDSPPINKNHRVSNRWIEFPYLKAIPFDPKKLRSPRSTIDGNSLITIPHNFPYSRAIPYDPWKFNAIRKNIQDSFGNTANSDKSDNDPDIRR